MGNVSTLEEKMKNLKFKFFKTNICDRKAIYKIFVTEHPNTVVNFTAEPFLTILSKISRCSSRLIFLAHK